MAEYLFSYGTLQKDKVQLETFGRLLKGEKDVLTGYTLSSVEITDAEVLAASEQQFHLIAIPTEADTDTIEGVIFEITMEELLAADEYEAEDYKRVKEKFKSGNEAWVYVTAG
ncbi:gamma-glutamylcyclotransferase family protein [Pedobacter psychroterrae]|uniref:Gamma-glutamylcyclotransferase n=1 Tax=Pedobacter psychroterrae TaxID=2530453 RepID=A0A4R0NAV1_9SPHI|nr:gamma-glutamylcyclotransferase family protein [Pedobacter psychroterrae]TCC97378.1 gamma-glutamylcyclotransferase [Pedobacter psychroterrae]